MITKELARAISTGKVIFGYKMAIKMAEEAKAFIVSRDCPYKEEIMKAAGEKPLYVFKGQHRAWRRLRQAIWRECSGYNRWR